MARLDFSGGCADAGLGQAWFAPAVGLVKWSEQSIAGPRDFTLIGGVIAGKHYPLAGMSIAAELPNSHLLVNDASSINAALTVYNNSASDLVFRFGNSQQYEISLLTRDGQVLKRWSDNKRFLMGASELTIKAGESHRFAGSMSLQLADGSLPDVGTYLLRIELTGSHAPAASAFTPAMLKMEAPLFIDRRMQAF